MGISDSADVFAFKNIRTFASRSYNIFCGNPGGSEVRPFISVAENFHLSRDSGGCASIMVGRCTLRFKKIELGFRAHQCLLHGGGEGKGDRGGSTAGGIMHAQTQNVGKLVEKFGSVTHLCQ